MVDEITLIKNVVSTGTNGRTKNERKRTILVEMGSPSRIEWGTAGQNGFQSDYVARTPVENFDGEEMAIYRDGLFSIYRTYLNDATGEIELYLSRKRGNEVWSITTPLKRGGSNG